MNAAMTQQTSSMIQQTSRTIGPASRPAPKTLGFPVLSRRTNMLALIREQSPSGRARLALFQIPVPHGRQALVRIALSYVCPANDLGPLSSSGSLGHQAVGVVCEVGNQVTSVRAGDRVIVDLPTAGDPRRDPGGPSGASGTHAEYTLVADAERALVALPASISMRAALLVGDIGLAGLRLAAAAVRPGNRVLIYSASPIGLAAAMIARTRGAASIAVVDADEKRLEHARTVGAGLTLIYGECDPQLAVRDLGGPADVVLNAMAGTEVIGEHLSCLRPGGTIVFLESSCGGHRSLPFWAVVGEALVISAPALPRREAIAALFDQVASGELPLQSLIGRTLALGSAQDVFDSMRACGDDGLACAIAPPASTRRDSDTLSRLGW